jgi:hypothetical protein
MNVANKIGDIATDDQRQTIPWVRFTDRSGNEGIRRRRHQAGRPGQRRTSMMDCMDCHNRPAHTFAPSAERAIDMAIASGELPRTLPFARREAVAAVKDEYPSGDDALRGIEARLKVLRRQVVGSGAAEDDCRRPGHLLDEHLPRDESEVGHVSEQHRPQLLQWLLPVPRREPQGEGRHRH